MCYICQDNDCQMRDCNYCIGGHCKYGDFEPDGEPLCDPERCSCTEELAVMVEILDTDRTVAAVAAILEVDGITHLDKVPQEQREQVADAIERLAAELDILVDIQEDGTFLADGCDIWTLENLIEEAASIEHDLEENDDNDDYYEDEDNDDFPL